MPRGNATTRHRGDPVLKRANKIMTTPAAAPAAALYANHCRRFLCNIRFLRRLRDYYRRRL